MTDGLKYKNVFLVGFMGAGKTTVGRLLAEKTGYEYLDADEVIEKNAGKSITQIFADHGEDYFRDLETQSLKSLAAQQNHVIATGGGVVMREENWQAMKSGGVTVYLKAPIEIIWERIKHSTTRPLLQVDNPLETARELLGRRESMYQKADLIVDTEHLSVEGAADELLKSLKS